MRDIEKDFQSSNGHSGSVSPIRSIKSSKLNDEKAIKTEKVMSYTICVIMLTRTYQQPLSNSTSDKR